MNENLKTLIKVIVSISLFSLVLYSADPSEILEQLQGTGPLYLSLAALLVVFLGKVVSAKKWQILLHAKGEDVEYTSALRHYYIGTFFNLFLPTTIGGDVIRAHKISDEMEVNEEAFSSVFMERFTGLVALVSLAAVSSVLYFGSVPLEAILVIFVFFIPAMVFIFILITRKSIVRRFSPIYRAFFRLLEFLNFREKIKRLYFSINQYKKHRRAMLLAVLMSFLFHVVLIVSNFCLSRAVGMSVPFYYFFVYIPISAVLLFLPISIKGFGVREVLYAHFFTQVGAVSAEAVSMSILFQLLVILGAGVGGGVYLLSEI